MNIAKRRQFEDEERSREEKWLSRKLELQHSSFKGGYQPANSSHSDTPSSDWQEKDSHTDKNRTPSSNQQNGEQTYSIVLQMCLQAMSQLLTQSGQLISYYNTILKHQKILW